MPDLGTFSLSLTVNDLDASLAFYRRLGFEPVAGEAEQGWLILAQGEAKIGLFHGMFDSNIITFNPPDVRAIRDSLQEQGVEVSLQHAMIDTEDPAQGQPAERDEGPAHFTLTDPDGNALLFDQH